MYKVFDLDEPDQWNHALKCIPCPDIFYQSEYCRIFEIERKEQGKLFVYQSDEGDLVYPFFLRRINDLPCFAGKLSMEYFDVTSPYGFAGPVCSGSPSLELIRGFQKVWQKYCQANNIVTEFIRFHPILENHLYPWQEDLKVEQANAIVIIDLTRSKEEIWSGYQYNNRKNINRAMREGLRVIIEEKPDHLGEFWEIYQNTMNRRQAAAQYYFSSQFFSQINNGLKGSFAYAYVLKDQQVISAELLLYQEPYLHSFLGGTLAEYFNCRPNNLLKHQVILWAKAKGLKYFILGGGYQPKDGIFQYKLSFSPNGVRDFYVGKRVLNPDVMVYLEKLRGVWGSKVDEKFFPTYRKGVEQCIKED